MTTKTPAMKKESNSLRYQGMKKGMELTEIGRKKLNRKVNK